MTSALGISVYRRGASTPCGWPARPLSTQHVAQCPLTRPCTRYAVDCKAMPSGSPGTAGTAKAA